jgi:hypothetical protein
MSETTPPTSANTTASDLPPTRPPAGDGFDAAGAGGGPAPERKRRGGFGRVLKWLFVLILLLLIGGGLFVYFYLDRIVRHTVETQSTAQLNLKTELEGAHVSLLGGQVSLSDLRIASPQGFQAPQMFSLGQADVKASVGELRGDPVRVSNITLNQPKLVIENNGGTFNFKKAMDLMPKTETKPADQDKPLKVVIGDLTVKDPVVVVRPGKINIPGLTLPEEITVNIPTISMKNIGTGEGSENGAAIKDVVMQVITVMASSAANSGKLPAELQGLLNVNVNQMVSGLTAEARKRIAEALPGDAGRIASEILADPQALLKNPGAVVGGQVEQLKGQAQAEAQKRIGGALDRIGIGGGGDGSATQPSTQPATQPADRVKQEAGKAIEQGLGGLLNRDKKDKDRKAR